MRGTDYATGSCCYAAGRASDDRQAVVSPSSAIPVRAVPRKPGPLPTRRPVPLLLVPAICLAVLLLSGSRPAVAFTEHRYQPPAVTEVTPTCSPNVGSLENADAMTVFGGDLYTTESLDGQVAGVEDRVDELSAATGACVSQLPPAQLSGLAESDKGIALADVGAETELYLGALERGTSRPVVAAFGVGPCGNLGCASLQAMWTGADTPAGRFGEEHRGGGEVDDVALDASTSSSDWAAGDVFVLANGPTAGVVDIFKPEVAGGEKYVAQVSGTAIGQPFSSATERMAVSGFNGELAVQDGTEVDLFVPAGIGEYSFLGTLAPPSGKFEGVVNLTFDSDSGEIYVVTSTRLYQFSAAGGYLGSFGGEETEQHSFSPDTWEPRSAAVDPTTHDVFLAAFDAEPPHGVLDRFGPDVVVPDVVGGPVTQVAIEPTSHTWSVQLNGSVDPDGAGEATCWFAWGLTAALESREPCAAVVGDGSSAVAVHAVLHGLAPDTRYTYRLQARNENGTNLGEAPQDEEFTTPGPGLRDESVTDVAAEGATLHATIGPNEAATAYRFEYDTAPYALGEAPHGIRVPLTDVSIGNGNAEVEVQQPVEGLAANTRYHYRVVVISEISPGVSEEFDGPDATFSTQPAARQFELPDDRHWELVSPPDKHGAVIMPIGETELVQAAAGGEAFTYLASVPTEAEPQGFGDEPQVLAQRSPSGGWSSSDIGLPHSAPVGVLVGVGHEYRFFSEDLSLGVAESFGPFTEPESEHALEAFPEATERTPYLRHDTTCAIEPATCYAPMVTAAPEYEDVYPPSTRFGGSPTNDSGDVGFAGATPDLGHVVLESSIGLTATHAPHGGLYEWTPAQPPKERLALLSILPAGEGAVAATQAELGAHTEGIARHAISANGERIFFSAAAPSQSEQHLYMRDTANAETVRLDLAEGGSPPSQGSAFFQTANAEGTRAFFTDAAPLTGKSGKTGEDLYVCGLEEVNAATHARCDLRDLTPAPREEEPAAVQGDVLGASEDGSYVYFVADGVLAPGATPGDCGPRTASGEATCNLYVAHSAGGEQWTTTFIATLSGDDAPDWAPALNELTARVSPDGSWLAFMSDRSLTGYDNHDALSGRPDEEVYLYDAASGRLICASCNPDGARPLGVEYGTLDYGLAGGDRVWSPEQWLAANIPGWTPYRNGKALHQSRYLSNSGRLFFNSSDALVPQDTNGNEDVYEYEPPEVGSCNAGLTTYSAAAEGCIGLISSGAAFGESAFLDASESGEDVFFLTGANLVAEDLDGALDVYDAHECTTRAPCASSAVQEESECDSSTACRGSSQASSPFAGPPASATITGSGNLPPAAPPEAKKRSLTRTQKLIRALQACKQELRRRRAECRRQARRRYGPVKASGKRPASKTARAHTRRRKGR